MNKNLEGQRPTTFGDIFGSILIEYFSLQKVNVFWNWPFFVQQMEIIVAICNHKYILQLFPIKRGSSNRVSYSSLFVLAQCGQSSFEFALNVSIFSSFSSKKFEYRIFSNNAFLKQVPEFWQCL